MKNKMTEKHIRAGEDRAFRVFQRHIAKKQGHWVRRSDLMKFRGLGRTMVRRVYAVARHVEGARLSKALGRRGVDTVSLSAVRTALRRAGDGLLEGRTNTRASRKVSRTGVSLLRYIRRTA